MDLNRRDFLKVIGLGAAGSALPGCGGETAKLIPAVLPDEEIVPGVAHWYASVCRECEAGCGIIVRVMEGRAKKIEGNPDHPLNRGKLCALGQASLQGLYNPDRIRGPLQRDGERGEGRFKPIPWEDAMSRWVAALQKHPDGAVLISRPVPGTLAGLFSTFMKEISGTVFFYEPSAERPLRAANRKSFGIDFLPDYDLANTTHLLSFGTPFLSHWLSPVHFGGAYGRMRQGRPAVRGRFVQVEPRLSMTAASADRWVPIRPGTEGLLAIAIGRLILKEGRTNLSREDRGRFEKFYDPFSIDRIANETGVAEEEIVRLAREFYTAASPLAIGGGIASEQTNGTDTLVAINALNLLVGNINQPGGIHFFQPSGFPVSSAEVVGEQALLDLKNRTKKPSRALLMLYQSNPLYTLPPSTQFRQVFEEADLIVSFSSFLDESTAMADLILPDHFFLESWGDHVTEGIAPAVGLAQPVVIPRYDTRPVGDLFLSAANRIGGGLKERLSWTDFRTMVREQWQDFFARRQPAQPFDAAWVEALQRGGLVGTGGEAGPDFSTGGADRAGAGPVRGEREGISVPLLSLSVDGAPSRRGGQPSLASGASRPVDDGRLGKLGGDQPENRAGIWIGGAGSGPGDLSVRRDRGPGDLFPGKSARSDQHAARAGPYFLRPLCKGAGGESADPAGAAHRSPLRGAGNRGHTGPDRADRKKGKAGPGRPDGTRNKKTS
ncbi:MAG: molybdopterin-dependent oxidoreductase [Candidatus Manganitrophus sp.]|nr:MAG: molybdopterin-dependent oxidoreductase [Candidatus Manganitrophus sp.]